MRDKALQSRQSNAEDAKPYNLHVEPYDELAIFGGRTGLVMPKRSLDFFTAVEPPSNIRLPSIPNLLHSPPVEAISPPISHPSYRSDPQPQPVYVANDVTSTSATLPLNWEGLYREIPD